LPIDVEAGSWKLEAGSWRVAVDISRGLSYSAAAVEHALLLAMEIRIRKSSQRAMWLWH
jgi:hypothetical protein